MSQEPTPADGSDPLPAQPNPYATSTESETSDDVSETSDTALSGAISILRGRKRRRRTIIAADQLMKMESLYKQEQWPGREKKEALARDIGMSTHFVNIWFQNKRSRMKKLAQEEAELQLLRKTRSPGTVSSSKADPGQGSSMGNRPIAIAPKPPFANTASSPMSATRIPKVDNLQAGQCLVIGQHVSITNASSSGVVGGSSVYSSPTVKMQTHNLGAGNPTRIEIATPPKPPVSMQLQQSQPPPANTQAIPACNIVQTQLPRQRTTRQLNFFKCLVSMMAVEEGGLVKKTAPEFDIGVNAALYGLRIANGNILTYKKSTGLFIHNDQH